MNQRVKINTIEILIHQPPSINRCPIIIKRLIIMAICGPLVAIAAPPQRLNWWSNVSQQPSHAQRSYSAQLLTAATTIPQRSSIKVPEVTIAAIQGRGAQSALRGQRVRISGVVTAVFQGARQLGGFFMQQVPADQDPRTSDGIFVQAPTPRVTIGLRVTLTGRVAEQFASKKARASRTVLVAESIEQQSRSTASIAPKLLLLPQQAAQLEHLEGMLVDLNAAHRPYTVIDTTHLLRYGQLMLAAPVKNQHGSWHGNRLYQPTQWYLPDSPQRAQLEENNQRRKMIIDDGTEQMRHGKHSRLPWYIRKPPSPLATLRIGDMIVHGLSGILDFGPTGKRQYGYRLQVLATPTVDHANVRPTPPQRQPNTLRIVSYNAQNYFTSLQQRGASNARQRMRQRLKTTAVLQALDADLIALQEIENNHQAIAELTG